MQHSWWWENPALCEWLSVLTGRRRGLASFCLIQTTDLGTQGLLTIKIQVLPSECQFLPLICKCSDHLSVEWDRYKSMTPSPLCKSSISPHKPHQLKLANTFYQQLWIKWKTPVGSECTRNNYYRFEKACSCTLWMLYLYNVISDVYCIYICIYLTAKIRHLCYKSNWWNKHLHFWLDIVLKVRSSYKVEHCPRVTSVFYFLQP